jgi:hypothetical protein
MYDVGDQMLLQDATDTFSIPDIGPDQRDVGICEQLESFENALIAVVKIIQDYRLMASSNQFDTDVATNKARASSK